MANNALPSPHSQSGKFFNFFEKLAHLLRGLAENHLLFSDILYSEITA
jgi:hypothetical protein